VLLAAAVLKAPDDPSGRGLVMVVAVVLVLLVVTVHVRLLLRVAPRDAAAVGSVHERADDRTDDEPAVLHPTSPAAAAPAPPPREPVDARIS
jgi:hypothetical protein